MSESRNGERSPSTERVPAGGALRAAFVVVLAGFVAAGFLVDMHPHFAVERLPGFNAMLGLVACAILVAGAKLLGALLGRHEDYHDR